MDSEAILKLCRYEYGSGDLGTEDVFNLVVDCMNVYNSLKVFRSFNFDISSHFASYLKSKETRDSLKDKLKNTDISKVTFLTLLGVSFLDTDDAPNSDNRWKLKAVYQGEQYIEYSDSPHDLIDKFADKIIDLFYIDSH
jgi:hypothetical protein